MNLRNRSKQNKGFTLGELLLVVAIIIILLALVVPSIFAIQKRLRQTELDAKAETIYVGVQNKLSKMMAAGTTDVLKAGTHGVSVLPGNVLPSDIPAEDLYDADTNPYGVKAGDICYFTSEDLDNAGSAANVVMSGDTVDDTLLNNHWVVEFNPSSCVVYAVFYSEDRIDCAEGSESYVSNFSTYDTSYRVRENRLSAGAKLGYYSKGAANSGSTVTEISPVLTVINAEKLTANVTCTVPSTMTDAEKKQLTFKLEIEDTDGNIYTAYYLQSDADISKITGKLKNTDLLFVGQNDFGEGIVKNGDTYTLDLTLDDLTSGSSRFVSRYGNQAQDSTRSQKAITPTKLLSGTPIKITVTAMCLGNNTVSGTHSDSAITNSLFADDNCTVNGGLNADYGSDTDNAAIVTYGRHLQNMDASSGVNKKNDSTDDRSNLVVKYYRQNADIDFKAASGTADDTTDDIWNWADCYSASYYNGTITPEKATTTVANFSPISNQAFTVFDGQKYTISNLTEQTNGKDAGLFESLGTAEGQTVQNVMLNRSYIKAAGTTDNAGAIAGSATGTTTISGCQVYLTGDDLGIGTGKDKSNEYVWISGKETAGGLIGTVTDGTVTITNSSASTVIGSYPATAVTKDDKGSIRTISSFDTKVSGGLIGSISGGTVSISGSYADNYLAGTQAGGLVGKGSSGLTIDSCYTSGFMSFTADTDTKKSSGITDTASSISNTYSIVRGLYLTGGAALKVTTANIDSSKMSNVFYMPSGTDMTTLCSSSSAFQENAYTPTAVSPAPVLYNLMNQGLTTYDYPVLTAVPHYGDYQKGYILNLKNGTAANIDPIWSNVIPDDAFSTKVGNVNTYTAPVDDTGKNWVFDGWYITYEQDTTSPFKPTASNTLILDTDGKIVAAAGTYDGFTISESNGVKTMTLSKNVTLYACWHKADGAKTEIYVLTNTFSYDSGDKRTIVFPKDTAADLSKCHDYLIVSTNAAGSAVAAGTSGAGTIKLISKGVTVLDDKVYASNPYIMASDVTAGYIWTAIPSRSLLYKNADLNSKLPSIVLTCSNNVDEDYGSAYTLMNTVSGTDHPVYLNRNVNSYGDNTADMGVSEYLYGYADGKIEATGGSDWYFEDRMFKYSTDFLRGRFGGSSWLKVLYFEYDSTGTTLSDTVLDSSDSDKIPTGSKQAYIYEKQEVDTEAYTFDIYGVYTLTYKDGDTTLSTVTVKEGSSVVINGYPENKTDGQGNTLVCDGWSTTKDGTASSDYAAGNTVTLTGDTTLYAHWSKKYTVTYYFNGGESKTKIENPVKVDAGATVTLPEPKDRSGYVFAGWYDQSDSTRTTHDAGYSVTINKDTSFVAKWNVTVTFNENGHGSTTPSAQTVATGDTVTEPAALTETGYIFGGWYKNDSTCADDNKWDFDSEVTEGMTLYAKWTPITYTIAFDANGGSGTTDSMTGCEYGKSYNLTPNAFTRAGYTFIGWNTQANGSGTSYTDKESVSNLTTTDGATVTLYAQWDYALSITKSVDKSAVTAGDKVVYTIKVTNGSPTAATVEVTDTLPTGLTFDSVTAASTGAAAMRDSDHPQDVTWSNVSVPANSTVTMTITALTDVNLTTTTTYKNTASMNDGTSTGENEAPVTVTPKPYTITYDANGGSGTVESQTGIKGTKVNLRANTFTRSGYKFKNWNTQKDGKGTSYAAGAEYTINGNATLYAIWEYGLSITKAADPSDTVASGKDVKYTITLTNNTNAAVTVKVVDTLPDNMTISVKNKGGASQSGLTLTWDSVSISANGSTALMVTITTASGVTTNTDIINSVTMTDAENKTSSASATVAVVPAHTLTLYNGMQKKDSDGHRIYWSAPANDSFSSVSSLGYTSIVTSQSGWTFLGWYNSKNKSDGKPTGTAIIDKDGNVVGADGTYDGFTISSGSMTLSADVTLYACWVKKGPEKDVYQLTTEFKDGKEYILASGTEGDVTSVYMNTGNISGTTAPVNSTTLTVTKEDSTSYIYKSKQTEANQNIWNQLIWKAQAFSYTSGTKVTDGSTVTYEFDYDGYYLVNQGNSANTWYLDYQTSYQVASKTAQVNIVSTEKIDNNDQVGNKSYEFRMWKYDNSDGKGLIPCYGQDLGRWTQIAYFLNDSLYTTEIYKAKGQVDDNPTVAIPSNGKKVYIYEKVTAEGEDEYSFDFYTATYRSNVGGSVYESSAVAPVDDTTKKAYVTLPTAPAAPEGYTFEYWESNSATYDPTETETATISDDTEFTAKWTENTYTITYDMKNGGTNPTSNPATYKYGTGVTSFAAATGKTGYTFKGWFDALTGGNEITSISTTDTGDKTLYAQWTANSYTIIYNRNENATDTTSTSQTATYDAPVTIEDKDNTWTYDGFNFTGWNTQRDGKGTSYKVGDNVSNLTAEDGGTVTLYAQWKSGLSISKTADHSTVTAGSNVTYTITITNDTAKAVNGLKVTDKLNEKFTFVSANNGGSEKDVKGTVVWTGLKVNANSSLDLQLVVKTADDFIEDTQIANTAAIMDQGQKDITSEAVTITVQPKTFNITYDMTNGGTNPTSNPATYKYGTGVTSFADATGKTGYTFKGWFDALTGGNEITNISTTAAEDKTLYAQWTPNNYTIIYNRNENATDTTSKSQSATYDSSVTIEGNTWEYTEHTFKGWNTQRDGKGTSYKVGDNVSNLTSVKDGTVTLYAQWKINTYTITYDMTNGGTNPSTNPTSYEYGTGVASFANATGKTGYTFKGWFDAVSGGNKIESISNTDTGNKTLYAQWTPAEYTITYVYENGDDNTTDTYTIEYTSVNLPEAPDRTGYTFNGWKVTQTAGTGNWTIPDVDKADTSVTLNKNYGNVTFTAQWTPNTYTVNFAGGDGATGSMASESFDYDEEKPLSANTFTKTGYSFAGWSDGSGHTYTDGQKVSNLTSVNGGEVTLTAQWTPVNYTITYVYGNGSASTTVQYNIETPSVTLPAPTWENHAFNGWTVTQTAETGNWSTTDIDKTVSSVSTSGKYGNVTLTAKWTELCSLTLYYDGGSYSYTGTPLESGTDLKTVVSGYTSAPTRTGWTFLGWYTVNSSGVHSKVSGSDGVLTTAISGTVSLYACWSRTAYQQISNMDGFDNSHNYLIGAPSGGKLYIIIGASAGARTGNTSYDYSTGAYVTSENATSTTSGLILLSSVINDDKYKWTEGTNTHYVYNVGLKQYLIVDSPKAYSSSSTYVRLNSSGVAWNLGKSNSTGKEEFYYSYGVLGCWNNVDPKTSNAGHDTRYGAFECHIYKEVTAYDWSDGTTFTGQADSSDDLAEESANASAAAVSCNLTLMNGTASYTSSEVQNGSKQFSSYIAPTRTDTSWTLDGWYTANDGTGKKVLNADGSVVGGTVDGYVDNGVLALTKDTTLYACWTRITDAYVKTNQLKAGEDYLITATPDALNKTSLIALGQVSADTAEYTQSLTAVDPTKTKSEYMLYDETTKTTSAITDLFITDVTKNLVWSCAEDKIYGKAGALKSQAGYLRLNDSGSGYSFTGDLTQSTSGWVFVTNSNTLQAVNASGETVNISYYKDTKDAYFTSAVGTCYQAIGIYKRTTVKQTTFADETLDLTLSQETSGTTYSVKVANGSWPNWTGCKAPVKDGYQLLGWFDSTADDAKQILDANGMFAGSDVEGYISGGRWICSSGNITLYAKWTEVTEDTTATSGTSADSSEDDTYVDDEQPTPSAAPTNDSSADQTTDMSSDQTDDASIGMDGSSDRTEDSSADTNDSSEGSGDETAYYSQDQ